MPTSTPLSYFMRRLLTGYAVSFNRRNKRSGHLFQNRYKSIVCVEGPYLLELVRRPSKSRAPAAARGVFSHLAIFELGYNGKEVGKFLHLGPTGVSLASRRGEKLLKSDPMMLKKIMVAIDK